MALIRAFGLSATAAAATATAAAALLAGLPALAQVGEANVRALNLARQWAVNRNGGLTVYEPARCMVNTGEGGGTCLVRNDDKGFLFRFEGGAPGWQRSGAAPTRLTEILIAPDGRAVLGEPYNGAVR
jgi:hypothetical protein